jgi:hypothetical protein
MEKKYKSRKNQDNKTSSPKKILPHQHDEDFNTDDSKSSLSQDVGPGYDDTGLGNDAKSSLKDEPADPNRNKQNRKNQKN